MAAVLSEAVTHWEAMNFVCRPTAAIHLRELAHPKAAVQHLFYSVQVTGEGRRRMEWG